MIDTDKYEGHPLHRGDGDTRFPNTDSRLTVIKIGLTFKWMKIQTQL